VVEQRRQARLVQEHLHEGLVRRVRVEDPLDHHPLGEARRALVARQEHLTHPAHRDAV